MVRKSSSKGVLGGFKKIHFFDIGDFSFFHIKTNVFSSISPRKSMPFWYPNRCQIDEKWMMLRTFTPGTPFWRLLGGKKSNIYSLGSIFGAPGREERKNGSIMVPKRGPKSDQKSMQNEVVSGRRKRRKKDEKRTRAIDEGGGRGAAPK